MSDLNTLETIRTMPAYVVNLERRPDRRAQIEAELSDWIAPVEITKAVDGWQVPVEDVRTCLEANPHQKPRKCEGMAGCTRSHRAILQRVEPPFVVFEDDAERVNFRANDGTEGIFAPERWPDDADLALIGGFERQRPKRSMGWARARQWECTHAYVVLTERARIALLDAWAVVTGGTDRDWDVAMRSINAYGHLPQLYVQRASVKSDISQLSKGNRVVSDPMSGLSL